MESTGNLEIETGRGRMPVYCSVPAMPPPWPGVVVIHDFTGMSHDLRAQADWLASEGFLAVAPDLYYWGSRLGCLRTIMRDLGQRRGRSFDDIEAARGWLRDHGECTGDIGVIGFCMGGGYAVALAANRGFASASVNYGGCPSDAEEWLSEACPISGEFRWLGQLATRGPRWQASGSTADRIRGPPRRQGLSGSRPWLHERS